jgi:subtilisin family serine protease
VRKLLSFIILVIFLLTNVFADCSIAFAKDFSDITKPLNQAENRSNPNNFAPAQNQNDPPIITPNLQSLFNDSSKVDLKGKEKNPVERKEILVKYKNGANIETVKNKVKSKLSLKKFQLKKRMNRVKTDLIEIDQEDDINRVLDELKKDSNVLYAQENYKLYLDAVPSDQRFNEQWGLLNNGQVVSGEAGVPGIDIGATKAWDITTGSPNVIVGILDTGIDINHNDLKDNIFINPKEISGNGVDDDANGYVDDVQGYDFANIDNTVFDGAAYDAHGTHVAGIVAASSNNEGISGVAPNVKILPLKFIHGNYGYTSDAIEAIEYAKTMGVRIINCSWGGTNYNQALLDEMQNSGILFVCAAGNSGKDVSTSPVYPACFELPNVISVAAIDNKGSIAAFSNFGGTIDIASPGVNILSTLPGNSYGYMSGTSMATPEVTGVSGLLIVSNTNISNQEIKAKIEANSTPQAQMTGKVSSNGILNAYSALTGTQVPLPSPSPLPTPEPVPAPTTDIVTDYPFAFNCTIENGNSINTKFELLDSVFPYEKIQFIISGIGKKEAVFDDYLVEGEKEIVFESLIPDTEYTFNVKVIKSDSVDSYLGQLRINIKKDPETNTIKDVIPTIIVSKSPHNFTFSQVQAAVSKVIAAFSSTTPAAANYTSSTTPVATYYSVDNNAIEMELLATENNIPNNSFDTACEFKENDPMYGTIGYSNDVDYFKIKFNSNGNANFWLDAIYNGLDYDFILYDDNHNVLGSSTRGGNSPEKIEGISVKANCWYYVYVYGYNGSWDNIHCYMLSASNYPESSSGDLFEPNNSFETATIIQRDSITSANIHSTSDVDYYFFNVDYKSRLVLKLSEIPSGIDYDIKVYNNSQSEIDSSANRSGLDENISRDLEPGKYYIKVYPCGNYSSIQNYKLYFNCTPITQVITLDSPANGSQFKIGDTISLYATGTGWESTWLYVKDPNDIDYIALNVQSGNSCSCNYVPTMSGQYSFLAKGRDGSTGNFTSSNVVTVNVNAMPKVANLNLVTDKASSQPVGTTIKMTATADKAAEYKFYVMQPGSYWTPVTEYRTNNTYTWTPSIAGTYGLGVRARAVGSTVEMDIDRTVSFVVAPASGGVVTNLNLVTDKASSQPVGTTIKMTATADKAAEYKFYIMQPGSYWTPVTEYSTSNTYTWTPSTAGLYGLGVRARAVGSTVEMDIDRTVSFVVAPVSGGVVTNLNLATDKVSSQPVGTTIKMTATADKAAEYEFYIMSPGGYWTPVTPYSTNSTYNWTPTIAGTYGIGVRARAAGTNVVMDMDKTLTFVVTNITSLSFATDKASSQPVGTTIKMMASADKVAEFEFYIMSPGGYWTPVTSYSTNSTYNWTPTVAGTYGIGVRARAVGSTVPMDMDKTMNFVITGTPSGPVTSIALATDKASSQPVGTTIKMMASADKVAEFEFYIMSPGGYWTPVTSYSTNNTYNWTPTIAGTYGIGVRARAVGSTVPMDMDRTLSFIVVPGNGNQGTGKPDYYCVEANDDNGNTYKIYLTDLAVNSDITKPVTAIIAINGQTQGQVYSLNDGVWSTSAVYADIPDLGGSVVVAAIDSNYDPNSVTLTAMPRISHIKYKDAEISFTDSFLGGTGLTSTDFYPDEWDMFQKGVDVGIDDNYCFGLLQKLGIIHAYYDDYYFLSGKVLVDSIAIKQFTDLSNTAAMISIGADAVAVGSLAVGGVCALSGVGVTVTAGAGVVAGGAIVASAELKIVAVLAITAANRSLNILNADNSKLSSTKPSEGGGYSSSISAGAPGSSSWNSAVNGIKNGRGKGVNYKARNQQEAQQLLNEAKPGLEQKPTYTDVPYKSGYEYHPVNDSEISVGNTKPHIKWKDWSNGKANGADGHIFYDD